MGALIKEGVFILGLILKEIMPSQRYRQMTIKGLRLLKVVSMASFPFGNLGKMRASFFGNARWVNG